MKTTRRILAAAAVAMILAGTARADAAQNPPNIILVYIDDMGWGDLSCFGNTEARTPRIDRMATEGIAFERFYVNSPICSPSRVAVSTGQYPQRWRITSYLEHRDSNAQRGMADWLDPRAPMLARALHEAGYATGHFGKWHMGGQRDVDDAPPITAYGFEESLTNFEGMGPKLLPLTMRPGWESPRRIWADAERLGGPVTWMPRSEITGGFVKAAMAFLDRAVADRRPFYINLWPDDVHSPFWPPVERWNEDKRIRYLAVLEEMDRQLGPLFDRVRTAPALRDNTVILICSDNGPEPGAGRADILKGYKTHLYEGGLRSPLIVWGPGRVAPDAAGTRNRDSVIAAIDLAPSLLHLAGIPPPAGTAFDGEVRTDTLLGRAATPRLNPLFFSRPPDRKNFFGFENLPDLAVIHGNWKLLCDYDGSRPALYDLATDPSEARNLATASPDKTRELSAALLAWHQQVTHPDDTAAAPGTE
jgi:arylsulfatase A-like enzyme